MLLAFQANHSTAFEHTSHVSIYFHIMSHPIYNRTSVYHIAHIHSTPVSLLNIISQSKSLRGRNTQTQTQSQSQSQSQSHQQDDQISSPQTSSHANTDTQQISSANTIKAFDLEYSLDSLQPSSIFKQNATYLFNGQYTHLPSSSVYEKDYDDEIILASYNNKQEIHSVIVQDRVRRQTAELKTVGDNKLATIDNNEHANNVSPGLRNMFKTTISTISSVIRSRINDPTQATNDAQAMNETVTHHCTEYDVIDIAIAYDTSYCNTVGGRENAEVEIASVVSLVSKMYQQNGLCMKVEISYLEGYCEIENDPYSGLMSQNLDSSSLLFEFRKYWNQNRQDVHRTVAHLFTATGMSDKYIGRGYGATICMKASAYSVNQITWSPSLQRKAALVAHELGHNVGANHIDTDNSRRLSTTDIDTANSRCVNKAGDFIMNSVIGAGTAGFHATSVQSMREVVNSRTCMRKELV